MSDEEANEDEYLDALEELVEMAHKDGFATHLHNKLTDSYISTALYDAGTVNVLLDLLRRVPDAWEIQYRTCEVLKLMTEENGSFSNAENNPIVTYRTCYILP